MKPTTSVCYIAGTLVKFACEMREEGLAGIPQAGPLCGDKTAPAALNVHWSQMIIMWEEEKFKPWVNHG